MFRLWRPIITNTKQHNCFIYKTLRWRARQVTPESFEDYVEEQMLGCKREVERIKLRIADWDKKISDWQVAWATAQTKKKAAEEVLFLIKYVLTAMYWGNNAPAE